MEIRHETKNGYIEVAATLGGLCRFRKENSKLTDIPIATISVRTGMYSANVKKSAEIILQLPIALDKLSAILPPCIMVLMTDDRRTVFNRLPDTWVKLPMGAIKKSDRMLDIDYNKYLERMSVNDSIKPS